EIRRTQIEADRARRNAEAAGSEEARQRLADRAVMLARWEEMTRDLAARLAEAQAGYDAWETATAPTRERAVAADAEPRRRHPDGHLEPLRADPESAEPEQVVSRPEPSVVELEPETRLAAWPGLGPHADRLSRVAAQLREISERLDEAAMLKAREAR